MNAYFWISLVATSDAATTTAAATTHHRYQCAILITILAAAIHAVAVLPVSLILAITHHRNHLIIRVPYFFY